MRDDFADLAEDVGRSAIRAAVILACLIGSALFALGVLVGMVL